jgi:uncharacterized protein YlxW (UPF0749 family)
MSRTTDYVLDMVDRGELIFDESKGQYVKTGGGPLLVDEIQRLESEVLSTEEKLKSLESEVLSTEEKLKSLRKDLEKYNEM